jgi:hypothetical protein
MEKGPDARLAAPARLGGIRAAGNPAHGAALESGAEIDHICQNYT